jgi:glycosyltransferase involved in cell wall biosynthesis
MLRDCGNPLPWLQRKLGIDNFYYPATSHILSLLPTLPDIIHCHNLHGDYFDLRYLPQLSHSIPTILNLRDAWLLSGHCAFSFDCERWKHGCGNCPDLSLFPAINKDVTAFNWNRKRKILLQSKIYVTTPSHWLMEKVKKSIVSPAILDSRVIPNGVNTAIFFPRTKESARNHIGLPVDAEILLIVANGLRNNVWKDFKTLHASLVLLGKLRRSRPLLVIAIGEPEGEERLGEVLIKYIPYINDPRVLAHYYQAADIYVHAARIESFGNVLLEARACGTPVVASAVGGIPEHVKSLHSEFGEPGICSFDPEQAHGILIPSRDSNALAKAVDLLLDNPTLRFRLGQNGACDVSTNFSYRVQADKFLFWYREILSNSVSHSSDTLY